MARITSSSHVIVLFYSPQRQRGVGKRGDMETLKDTPEHTGVSCPQRNKLGIGHNPKSPCRAVEGSERKQQHGLRRREQKTEAQFSECQRYKRKYQRAVRKAGPRPDPSAPRPQPGRVTSVLAGRSVGVTASGVKLDRPSASRRPPQVTHTWWGWRRGAQARRARPGMEVPGPVHGLLTAAQWHARGRQADCQSTPASQALPPLPLP